ncbi:MAG: exodeoxyribonuclease large subunit [Actinomycetota bacterium]
MAGSDHSEFEWVGGAPALTVGQFAEVMKGVLDQSFPDGVWVEGEIQGLKPPRPHMYFSLVENDRGRSAQVNITVFANVVREIRGKLALVGAELKDGMRVRLFGEVDFYAPTGRLGLKVTDIDTKLAAGDIAAKRAELVQRLKEDGSTQRNKRCEVPLVPLRLGIISSSQAAGYGDLRKHLDESGYAFGITLCDVRVQGDAAPAMIVDALGVLGRRDDIDVVLLIRGGGSKSDLATFDDEGIARAIAACPHPVFTGIGHDMDESIADLVAHTACKTPTACADLVIDIVSGFVGRLGDAADRVNMVSRTALVQARGRVSRAAERLTVRPRAVLEREMQRLAVHSAAVRLLDPASTMARGWSITRTADGRVVRSVDDVGAGDVLSTSVANGTITSRVEGDN